MSKKLLAVVALFVLLVLTAVVWWLKPAPAAPSDTSPSNSVSGELFPSGDSRGPVGSQPTASSSLTVKPSSNGGSEGSSNLNSPLYQISTKPVSGLFMAGTGATSSLVYVERATGHLYQVAPASRLAARLSNTTLPKIYQVWGGTVKNEVRLLARYVKDGQIQNFAAGLVLPTTSPEDSFVDEEQLPALRGRLWNDGVFDLAISPKQDQVFYLETNLTGGTTGYLTDWAGNKPTNIFSSPLTEWVSQWPATSTIAILSKPGYQVPGYLYWLNPKTKDVAPILSEVPGLTALTSPNLKTIIYSGFNNDRLTFGLYDVATKIFGRLSVVTVADKCVWAKAGQVAYCGVPRQLPAGDFPDNWYRGEVSLVDNIWQIDAKTKQAQLLFNPKLAGTATNLDLTHLTLSADEKTLYFVNKNDSQLWALNLAAGF